MPVGRVGPNRRSLSCSSSIFERWQAKRGGETRTRRGRARLGAEPHSIERRSASHLFPGQRDLLVRRKNENDPNILAEACTQCGEKRKVVLAR